MAYKLITKLILKVLTEEIMLREWRGLWLLNFVDFFTITS